MSDKPIAYFKATEKHGILWSEDCCCADPIYGDYEDYEGHQVINLAVYPASAYEALQNELETERMRLAACGVAALGNTKESVKERINKENPYYSASYADVCRAVDAEIKLRDEVERLKAENEALRKQVEELETETAKDHVKIMHLKDALSAYGDPDVFADDED